MAQNTHQAVINIARKAGELIMQIYSQATTLEIQDKSDGSPITRADRAAHEYITTQLSKYSDLPVLSEESATEIFERRHQWQAYWLVDPLDGTKEFIKRNGQFTVNIALVDHGIAVWGCVVQPVTKAAYWGAPSEGAWAQTDKQQVIKLNVVESLDVRTLATGSHQNDRLARFIDALKRSERSVSVAHVGSSLKLCEIAAGRADLYPRFSPTSEWDTAAGQAILEGAGGELVDFTGRPFTYNQRETLLNGDFLAMGKVSAAQKKAWMALAAKAN